LPCLFWRWGLENHLSRLVSNCNPPNFSLSSSWDYRHEPDFLNVLLHIHMRN
jgi:hypothetical protein